MAISFFRVKISAFEAVVIYKMADRMRVYVPSAIQEVKNTPIVTVAVE